jgi:Class II flagellar assembly regulator
MRTTAARLPSKGGLDLRDVNLNDCTLDSAGPTRVDADSADLMPRTAHRSGPSWMKVAQSRPSTGPTHGRRVAPGRSGGTGFAAHVSGHAEGPRWRFAAEPACRIEQRAGRTRPGTGAAHTGGRWLEDGACSTSRTRSESAGWRARCPRHQSGAWFRLLQAERPATAAAKLEAVVDEIELRAAVELAKRQQVAPGRGEHEPARTSDPA